MVHTQCENRLSKKSVVGRSRSAKNRACFKELENRGNRFGPSKGSTPRYSVIKEVFFGLFSQNHGVHETVLHDRYGYIYSVALSQPIYPID